MLIFYNFRHTARERWYSKTPQFKESRKKYITSEEGKAAIRRANENYRKKILASLRFKNTGAHLKEMIRNNFKSVRAFSFLSGVHVGTLSRWLKGETLPSYESFQKICETMSLSQKEVDEIIRLYLEENREVFERSNLYKGYMSSK